MITDADVKGRLTALWQRAHDSAPPGSWPQITRLTSGPEVDRLPPNFSAWAVGPWSDDPDTAPAAGRHVIIMPTLSEHAPMSIQHRYVARIVADGTGRCPLCSGVASIIGPDPERARAGFRVAQITVGVRHSVGCPAADFGEPERVYFAAFGGAA